MNSGRKRTVFHEIFNGAPPQATPQAKQTTAPRLSDAPPIGEKLSSGSTSTVYLSAENAVKKVTGEDTKTTLTEISIVTALSHPNVIKILTIAYTSDSISIVMPYYQCDLALYINQIKNNDGKSQIQGRIEDIAVGIASALDYVHSKGIIHGDIKPANVFVTMRQSGLTAIVADFGLARLVGSPPALHYVQTPLYRAPEVTVGAVLTTAIDVWSLGIILFELVGDIVAINTDDGTRYACAYYGIPPGQTREENINAIMSRHESEHSAAIIRRLSSVASLTASVREAIVGSLRFNPRMRLTAGGFAKTLNNTYIPSRARPLCTGAAMLSAENRVLTKKYGDAVTPSLIHTGAVGIAKILCGRLPELTDSEFAAARKLSSATNGQIL